MTDIRIFWHVNELNGWREVAEQQWNLIENSGLAPNVTEISLCGNGQPWTFVDWYMQRPDSATKAKIKFYNLNSSAIYHEWTTLTFMHDQAKKAEKSFYICYIHLKGLLRWGDENVGDWRNFMNYFTLERWQDNVDALNSGVQAVGTNYNTVPWNHFAGNFWWANSDYVKTLDPLIHPEDRLNRQMTQFAPHPTNTHWRFDHEAWICSKNPTYKELARSLEPGERHYRERYPRENYLR